ncbi:MAG TPA: glycoside hydrolase family 30 beta sandwich domain-containing protein, partial [Fibrobacteraceae bacterium]|nr:glycoside hydrolase family 30 beta sandwich domain-containing protein [Fibrobacteraceae bacterium]
RDTFTAAGITTPLYGPEPLGIGYNTFQSYMNSLSNLGEAPDGYAFHMYHNGVNDNSSAPYSSPESFRTALKSIGDDYTDAPLIMSEFCHLNQTSPSSYDMISLAQLMQIGFTDGNLAGYINWELLWGDSAAVNGQMISVSKPSSWGGTGTFTVNPEYHAMRHYSRFINPGWSRIEASVSGNDDVSAVAFKNANADSITLVVINAASSTQIPLEEYTVSDFKVSSITQSVTGGDMSKTLTNATCVTLPARSITTIVLVSGDETLSTASCGEETTVIPAYTGTPSGILIDDATVTGTTDWTADGSRGSLGTDTTASGQTVVTLTFADTAQATAGYSNLSFDMSGLSSSFSGCTAVVVAAYNDSSSSISINMSIDDSYVTTSTLAAGSWTSLTFSLAEDDTLGDKLSFNSDGYGPIHIANIYATGCDDDTSSSSDTSDIPTYSGSYTGVTMYDALTEGVSGWWHDASHSVSATAVKTKGGQTVAALTFAGYEQDGSDDYPYANLAYTLDSTADYSSCTGWSASIYATSTVYLNYNINWSYLGTATVSADDDWQTISFDLDDDDSITNGFEFNSDNAGPIYVANVYATGCENDTNVEEIMVSNPEQLQENATGTIYGLDGSRLWSGSLSKAIRGGSLQLSQLRPGLYLVRAGNKIFKAVKR